MVLGPSKDGLFVTVQPRLIGFACGQASSWRANRRTVYKTGNLCSLSRHLPAVP